MSFIPPTPELIESAASGDSEAWGRILDEVLPTVIGWCARLGGPSVDAEDAAHDVAITAMERLATLRDPVAFPAWLFGITRRVLAKHRRRSRWSSWLPLSVLAPIGVSDTPDDLGGAAMGVLEALPDAQREALVLVGIEERTCEEAAAILDVPVGTVKSRLRLARARFVREARVRGVLDVLAEHVPGGAS